MGSTISYTAARRKPKPELSLRSLSRCHRRRLRHQQATRPASCPSQARMRLRSNRCAFVWPSTAPRPSRPRMRLRLTSLIPACMSCRATSGGRPGRARRPSLRPASHCRRCRRCHLRNPGSAPGDGRPHRRRNCCRRLRRRRCWERPLAAHRWGFAKR
jgi:hypothetical protein